MYNLESDYYNDDYYYEYYYVDSPNETVSYRHKRQINQFKELNISINKHNSKAYFNHGKNYYELNISINLSINDFNHDKMNIDNQYILCDLKPVATLTETKIEHKPATKVASFFENSMELIKKVQKNILIAEVSSNEISPLMLNNIEPNFKCSMQRTDQTKLEFNKFTYVFILLNLIFLIIVIVLVHKVFFKNSKCCKYRNKFKINILRCLTNFFSQI